MYRYHLSRKKLNRSSAGTREKTGVLRKQRSGWRGIGSQWSGPVFRVTKLLLYVLPPAGILAAGVWGWNAVTNGMRHSNLFALQEVRTVGWERPQKIGALERLRSSSGASLLDLDLVALKGALLAEPWIKDVNLRKEYPDTLSVHVTERRPVAVLAGREAGAVVDETGTILEQWPNGGEIPFHWSRLPVIHGLEAASLRDGAADAVQRFGSALQILRAAPSSADQGLDLEIGRWDDIRVQRHGYWLRFGEGSFDEKWRRFLSVAGEIERRHEEVREVDLRFPDQVIVR
ncbi:MAG TPA: FtsQ-type POTRA domain-containing protein [Nitrospiria bacterium]|nr:FtsQ-type POTRA domain-containing protein [Nitrospiria bacterium]